jgi:DNA-binding LytR/AlgR family response regulator
MSPRAVIAEDEPLLARSLAAGLRAAWPELEIVAFAANGVEALERIEALAPAVVFLDIRMPGLSGLEVAAEIADRMAVSARAPALVFVTAHDEFALKAFDLAAIDYLLKPVDPARLAQSVARLKAQLAAPGSDITALVGKLGQVLNATPAPAQEHLTFIRAAAGNNVRMVPVAEVCYFQATDKYVSVITGDAELLIRTSLRDLLAQLPPTRFRQIHRGTIVNLDWVSSAARDESGRVSLKLKGRSETLAVSRVFAEQFRPM